jgi:hypothetical protein
VRSLKRCPKRYEEFPCYLFSGMSGFIRVHWKIVNNKSQFLILMLLAFHILHVWDTTNGNAPENPQRRVTSRIKTASGLVPTGIRTAVWRRRGTVDVIAKISFSRHKIKHGAVMWPHPA